VTLLYRAENHAFVGTNSTFQLHKFDFTTAQIHF